MDAKQLDWRAALKTLRLKRRQLYQKQRGVHRIPLRDVNYTYDDSLATLKHCIDTIEKNIKILERIAGREKIQNKIAGRNRLGGNR